MLLLHVNHFFSRDSEFSIWIKCRFLFAGLWFLDFSWMQRLQGYTQKLLRGRNQMAKFCRLNKERTIGSKGSHRNFLGGKETLKSYKGIPSLRSMVRSFQKLVRTFHESLSHEQKQWRYSCVYQDAQKGCFTSSFTLTLWNNLIKRNDLIMELSDRPSYGLLILQPTYSQNQISI